MRIAPPGQPVELLTRDPYPACSIIGNERQGNLSIKNRLGSFQVAEIRTMAKQRAQTHAFGRVKNMPGPVPHNRYDTDDVAL